MNSVIYGLFNFGLVLLFFFLVICRCDLKIVSDANQFFIEKILEQHDLLDCFSDIYTNPTSVDEIGKLRISPYHGGGGAASTPPHSCNLCPPNLCKVLL